MIFDTLRWHRTEADADRAAYLSRLGPDMTAAERTEYLAGLPGAYNYGDWNRVESAVATLAEPLELELTTMTGWNASSIWSTSDETRYMENLRAVTEPFLEDNRLPATLVNLTVAGANGIEAALWVSATGLLWAQDGAVFAADGLLRIRKQEAT